MNANDNPLLDFAGLPRFDRIAPEHVTPAIEQLLAEARATVERVATSAAPADWDGVAAPVAAALDRLDRAWTAVRHMNAVVSTPALREAYNGNLPKVTAFYADLGQDERLYGKYKAIAASPGFWVVPQQLRWLFTIGHLIWDMRPVCTLLQVVDIPTMMICR